MTQPAPVPTPPPGDPAPAPTTPPSPVPTPPADPAQDQPLGPAGQKALAAERDARKALEAQLKQLEPLKQLATAMAGGPQQPGGPSEVELLQRRFAEHEQQLAEERQARWRAEVAATKGLSPQQAARLQGSSLEEFTADADALLALFPAAQTAPSVKNPRPDPSQGSRGSKPISGRDAGLAEAAKRFGTKSTAT